MDYYKVFIAITPFSEWIRDIICYHLAEEGFESFVETEGGLEAYIPAEDYDEKNVSLILNSFGENHKFQVIKKLIKSKNWNEEWEKKYFKPLVVANKCVIHAPFHKNFPKVKYDITIEPGMSFGTGNHETTLMMLESILERDINSKTVLDMGCGTGILSILASLKGATKIMAVDISEWSFKSTIENADRNNINNVEAYLGNASLLNGKTFDLILANIHKNVLINDLPVYSNCLNLKGEIIISGFFREDITAIKNRAETFGLKQKGVKTKNNWAALIFIKI